MLKKEEIIIEKYKKAEEIRVLREKWKKQLIESKYKERIHEYKAIEKNAELELEAKLAWQFREGRRAINEQKRSIDSKIQAEILKLKVKNEVISQAKKFIRIQRPTKPKVNPLPYLNQKNKESLYSDDDETEIVEFSIPKKNLQLRLLSNTPTPIKELILNNHKRHVSPEVHRKYYDLKYF